MTTLLELARTGDAIAGTSSKLEKVRLLAAFLAATDEARARARPHGTSAARCFRPGMSAP